MRGVRFLFYRHEAGDAVPGMASLPKEAAIRTWSPDADGFVPRGSRSFRNIAWWAMTRFGLFERRDFTEITIWRDGRLLHRLIVTPRWFRFPFMAKGDLQLGDLWTHPGARGQGLARAGIEHAHRLFANHGGSFWYVVAEDNRASVRLIESCGYHLVGTGQRTSPWGMDLLGRYRLDAQSP